MKQCGNIFAQSRSSSKPTPRNLYPLRTLSKLKKGGQKKRKRGKNQTTSSFNTTKTTKSRRKTRLTRRKRKLRSSVRRQARSASSSSYDNDSMCSCCKRPCRTSESDKVDEISGSHTNSKSGSFQDSIPANSKQISPDASVLNPVFEQWDLNMAQAHHEPLEALGQFEPPVIPRAQEKPQEKPRGTCPAPYQNPCQELR